MEAAGAYSLLGGPMVRVGGGIKALPWLGLYGFTQKSKQDTAVGGGVRVTW